MCTLVLLQLLSSVLFPRVLQTSRSLLHILALVQAHSLYYIFSSCCQGVSLLGSHSSCLRALNPFLLLLLCVHPKSSLLRFLRQGTYIGQQSVNHISPNFHSNVTGFSLSSLHITTAHSFTFAASVYFVVYSSAFSRYFCNPSGVSDTRPNHLQASIPTPYLPPP